MSNGDFYMVLVPTLGSSASHECYVVLQTNPGFNYYNGTFKEICRS